MIFSDLIHFFYSCLVNWAELYLDKVLETPGNDGVVVESNIESHNSTGKAQTAKVGIYLQVKVIDINLVTHSHN